MMDRAVDNVRETDTHAQPVGYLVNVLCTHLNSGLSDEEASARLARYGPNELQERPRPTFWHLLLGQFSNFLVIILLASAIISLILGEYLDASATIAIVVLNAVLGVVQESKAEEALAALRKMAAPEARVIRTRGRDRASRSVARPRKRRAKEVLWRTRASLFSGPQPPSGRCWSRMVREISSYHR